MLAIHVINFSVIFMAARQTRWTPAINILLLMFLYFQHIISEVTKLCCMFNADPDFYNSVKNLGPTLKNLGLKTSKF